MPTVDLHTFPKTDAHFHTFSNEEKYVKVAREYNLHYININTDTHIFPSMEDQERISKGYMQQYPEYFSYITSFSMQGWNETGWLEQVKKKIERSCKQGAVGVKIWKNIGMELKKANGEYLMIDDPFFYPLFRFLSDKRIPVVAHLGEPRNCWLPLEEMTTERNKAYFSTYPQYHAYLHPEIPSYEKQIEARDNVLKRFPNLIFIGAHLGSLEWDVDEVALRLNKYPNFAVDLSSRVGHIQLQAQKSYEKVRHFFIQYADRIIYGTDAYNNMEKLQNSLLNDWTFLTSYNTCTSPDIPGTFRGLNLPEDVLQRIYYTNAQKHYLFCI